MSKNDKVFVAGHRGMVGSAIMRKLQDHGYTNTVKRARDELELIQQAEVRTFFAGERIDQVYMAAGRSAAFTPTIAIPPNSSIKI